MNIPHRGAGAARSRAMRIRVTIAVEEEVAPRKRADWEFPHGTCQCAAEVIVWVGMLARKSRAAFAQDDCDLWWRHSTEEQFLGDPFIGDAPVGLVSAVLVCVAAS